MVGSTARPEKGRALATAQAVEIRVLGPTEILVADRPVGVGGPRERAVLTLLVARGPSPVRAEQLIDDLWGDDPPAGAMVTLRSYVSTLRRTLRTHGVNDLIVTGSGGYSVPDRPGLLIDVRHFESLVTESERHHGLQPATESAMLRRALSLWRGTALADAASTVEVASLVSRLEELQLVALERWANADLLCGRHVGLAAELTPWCRAQPFRERLWGLLMISLYRSGRQAEALQAFNELRGRMVETFGLEPGPEIRRIELSILRHDEAFDGIGVNDDAQSDTSIHLPIHLRNPAAGFFVGRRSELKALDRCWMMTMTGSPAVALVAGGAGIGKTRLLSAWAAKVHDQGVTVSYGRCDEDAGRPYQPVIDAIWSVLLGIPAGERGSLVSPIAAEHLRLVLPDLERGSTAIPPTASMGPLSDRDQLFAAFDELLTVLGDRNPLVVVIEDLHRAGQSTLELIRYIAEHLGPRSPMLALSTRTEHADDGSPEDASLDFLTRLPGVTELRLDGLPIEEVSALVAEALDDPHNVELTEAIYESTAGNPLFIHQILAHVGTEPHAFFDQEGAVRSLTPSTGLREAIEGRLQALTDDQLEVLRVAAVVGVEFDMMLVEMVLPDHDVLRAVEAAQQARLVEELSVPEHFSFSHALIRGALYDQLSSVRRTRLHRRLGEIMGANVSSSPYDLEVLAHHFLTGARPGQTEKGAGYALAAGHQALDGLAFERAVELAQAGLDCLALDTRPDKESRCRLRLLLARGYLYGRDSLALRRAALLAAEDARTLPSPQLLAEAAIVGTELGVVGDVEDTVALIRLCEEALAALQPLEENAPLAGLVLCGWCEQTGGLEGGTGVEAQQRQAIALCRSSTESWGLVRSLFAYSQLLEWTPRIEDRMAIADELIHLGRRDDDVRAEAYGCHIRALALLAMGDRNGFEDDDRRLHDLHEQVANWFLELFRDLWRGMLALLDGRFEEVEAAGEALLARGGRDPNVVNVYFSQLCWLRREQGRFDEVLAMLLYAAEQSPQMLVFRCGLALTYVDTGDLGEARRELDRLADNSFGDLPRDTTFTTSLALLAEVVTRLNDAHRAEMLFELLAPYQGLLIVATQGAVCLGAADRYLGMLAATVGRLDEAESLFRAAESIEERAGAPRLANRTREWSDKLVGPDGLQGNLSATG